MELFNELSPSRTQAIEDFLTFIPIYESRKREIALRALLKKHRKDIQGRVVAEAGAARGIFAEEMAQLGASKVYAVERSPVLHGLLKGRKPAGVTPVKSGIEEWKPKENIDLLFHEFYGPLLLDESILALKKLRFQPGMILPDGGRLWAMPLSAEQVAVDPSYEPSWKDLLGGALISDLFTDVQFKPQWVVFDWNLSQNQTVFEFTLPEKAEWIVLCGEITHQGKSVLKLWTTYNWPLIFTSVQGSTFELKFKYSSEGYSEIKFGWKS